MKPIDNNRRVVAPAETPDRERLEELERCFECGAVVTPEDLHGSKVAEGITLCAECCMCASANEEEPPTLRLPPCWYDDLVGESHHT